MSQPPALNVIVRVVSANILKDFDGNGEMDPYVKVSVGKQTYETLVAEDMGQKPIWNGAKAQFGFFRSNETHILVEVWDDDFSSDDFIGSVSIAFADLLKAKTQGELTKHVLLDKAKAKIGEISLAITVDPKTLDPKKNANEIQMAENIAQQMAQQTQQERKAAKELKPNITVTIKEASIYKDYDSYGKMDPYFIMKMDAQKYETKIAEDQGRNPKWTTGATHHFYRTTEKTLVFELWEDDNLSSDDYIGAAVIEIEDLLNNTKGSGKYPIFNSSKQQVADVMLEFVIDPEIVINPRKQQKQLDEAAKKAEQDSLTNQAERKFAVEEKKDNQQSQQQSLQQQQQQQQSQYPQQQQQPQQNSVQSAQSSSVQKPGNNSQQNNVEPSLPRLQVAADLQPKPNGQTIPIQQQQGVNLSSGRFKLDPVAPLELKQIDSSKGTKTQQQLQQRTQELAQKLANLNSKISKPQETMYQMTADANMQQALTEGMKMLAALRPSNAIRELGMFLMNYKGGQVNYQQQQQPYQPIDQQNLYQSQQSNNLPQQKQQQQQNPANKSLAYIDDNSFPYQQATILKQSFTQLPHDQPSRPSSKQQNQVGSGQAGAGNTSQSIGYQQQNQGSQNKISAGGRRN